MKVPGAISDKPKNPPFLKAHPMFLLEAALLGLVQGVTEFLPVSSSGHLVIFEHLLNHWHEPGITFEIVLHLATLLAVVIFFYQDLKSMALGIFRSGSEGSEQRNLLGLLLLGTIPTGIIGVVGKKFFTAAFNRLDLVGYMLLVTALLLFLAESRKKPETASAYRPRPAAAMIIGIVQGLAILPGFPARVQPSATGIMLGMEGRSAARFSFLLSIPAICGASLLNLREITAISPADIPGYSCGFFVALATGLASLKLLLMIVEKRRLKFFALYCLAAGALTLALAWSNGRPL